MVEAKVAAVLTLVLVLTGTAAGFSFEVSIDAVTDHELHFTKYDEDAAPLQHINATVENIGSIGCTFRLKGVFEQENTTFTRWSSPYELYPGDHTTARLYYVPINYTGPVDTRLSVRYCDQEVRESSFSFNVTEREIVRRNQTVNATTEDVGEEQAVIRADVDGDLLVPREAPPYWKVGAAEIDGGRATVTYDAPIFTRSETLEYTVINRTTGDVTGTVRVDLEERPPTIIERLRDNLVLVGLVLSLLLNLVLAGRIVGVWGKVKF